MNKDSQWGHWTPVAWGAAAVLALWLASLSDRLAPDRGSLLLELFFGLIAVSAALHRPLGGSGPGIGAVALPLAVVNLGVVPAARIGLASVLVAELLHRWARRSGSNPPPERRHVSRSIPPAASAGLAVLAAGMAWVALAPDPPRPDSLTLLAAWTAGGVLGAVSVGLKLLRNVSQAGARLTAGARVGPIGVDVAGWAVGSVLALFGLSGHPRLAFVLLLALAALAAEAARNGRLVELSEQRIYGLEKVNLASWRMSGASSEMASVADRIRAECRNVIPFLWFQFELVAVEREGEPHLWSAGPGGRLREGAARPGAAPPPLPGIHRRARWRILAYPLRAEGRLIAKLTIWCDPRRVLERDETLLVTLLPQLAASVHRALLDHEAKSDPLTGLAVRRVLDRRLLTSYARALDEGGSMAVVMCDLDHFKEINDSLGHDAGDRALAAVAEILRQFEGPKALCSRYGGEEFTILMEGADSREALELAERVRRAVAEAPPAVADLPRPLTVSCGVAAFPELHIKTATELVLLADDALYEAKAKGRNRSLANLGHGRFMDLSGATSEPVEAARVEPPRFFA